MLGLRDYIAISKTSRGNEWDTAAVATHSAAGSRADKEDVYAA